MIETKPGGAVAAYEQLRRHMLAGSPGGGRFGLAVLLREGVAAWIDHCCQVAESSTNTDETVTVAPPTVPPQLHAGIVQILANIALTMTLEIHP